MKPSRAGSSRVARREKKVVLKRAAEVCTAMGVQPYVLKFWEGEFPQLRRRLDNKRQYDATALRIAGEIHELVDVRGMTLAEARHVLSERWPDGAESPVAPHAKVGSPSQGATESADDQQQGEPVDDRLRRAEERIETLQGELRRLRTADTDRERLRREVERLRSELVGEADGDPTGRAESGAEVSGDEAVGPSGLLSEVDSALEEARRVSKAIDELLLSLTPSRTGSHRPESDESLGDEPGEATRPPGKRPGSRRA